MTGVIFIIKPQVCMVATRHEPANADVEDSNRNGA